VEKENSETQRKTRKATRQHVFKTMRIGINTNNFIASFDGIMIINAKDLLLMCMVEI